MFYSHTSSLWQNMFVWFLWKYLLCLKAANAYHIQKDALDTNLCEPWQTNHLFTRTYTENTCVLQVLTMSDLHGSSIWSAGAFPMFFAQSPFFIYMNRCIGVYTYQLYQRDEPPISGWWYTYPSEKWWSSSVGMMTFPTEWKIIIHSCSKPPTSVCWFINHDNPH